MKIGLISDTHDNIPQIKKAVEIFNKHKIDFVIHAGDYIAPFSLKPFLELKADWAGVLGNNDGEKTGLIKNSQGKIKEGPMSLLIANKQLTVIHNLEDYKQEKADVIVFGHTHRVEVKKAEYGLLVNPGECSGWLYGKSTIAILDLDILNVEIITL